MITKNESILLAFSIIFGIFTFLCLNFYTIPNETVNFKNLSLSERLNIHYLNYHPHFDYLNGLWLMFGGLFWLSIISLIKLPYYSNIALNRFKTRLFKNR